MAEPTYGWAVRERASGTVLVRTIQDTERGAMVNWLVTDGKVFVTQSWTEAAIMAAFHRLGKPAGFETVVIRIEAVDGAMA